ncbi:MAG TPA: hypothetical protein VNW92_16040 [Polyangiaceae bacterium]|jgi:hypothetical protein|nr:hypothetical protein [Polyangiaceae bacterium]
MLRESLSQRPERSPAVAQRDARSLLRVAWASSESTAYFCRFVSGYANTAFAAVTAGRVTLASRELLENALRYSLMMHEITYELSATRTEVRVSVQNRTISSRVEVLRAQLKRIQEDPQRAYAQELERSKSSTGRRAMLGLVRICHEADMTLRASVDGSSVLLAASCRR